MKISIIIPTLNEEKYLKKTIQNIFECAENPNDLEILVIDAGSCDQTLESIRDLEVQTFSKPEFALKKYESLNFGIQNSTGEYLIFLDADTKLPKAFDSLIKSKLSRKNIVGGAFEFSFERPDWKLYLLQLLNRARYRLRKTYYGDQAIFCKREAAISIGGYPKKELMESAYFCDKLMRAGKLSLIRTPVKTSPRRFNENGFFKVFWFDFVMWIRFGLNLPVEQYGKSYWGLNMKSNG